MFKLADGSCSSRYNVGDKFRVTDNHGVFYKGSLIELKRNDGDSCPLFKLLEGDKNYAHIAIKTGYTLWSRLVPVKQSKKSKLRAWIRRYFKV